MEHTPPFAEPQRLDALDLTPGSRNLLATSLINYQRYARLVIRLEHHAFPHVEFSATQVAPALNGRILDAAEIAERAEVVLRPLIQEGWRPVVVVG